MKPEVSVVVSAFNAVNTIGDTLQSVLAQDAPPYELIVVDDGSSDDTVSVIDYAVTGVANVTVLRNDSNIGLTKSLIRGCGHASGKYIARIDAGDRYLPGRIAEQWHQLNSSPQVGLVSCGTRFCSAEGELLYSISQNPGDLGDGLDCCDLETIRGPSHHGSTMFRRDLYERVGGYRDVFRVAQDLDLWMRLHEASEVLATPEILYESRIFPHSISMARRTLQLQVAALILDGARCRRAGAAEPDYSARMPRYPEVKPVDSRLGMARYDYFVGGCLAKANDKAATRYFGRAWLQSPTNLRYGLKYLRSLLQ